MGAAPALIDTVGFKIDADFLSKLQDDPSRLAKQSGSIPGIVYNYPQTPEAGDSSWLFASDGGCTYRIYFNVQTGPVTLTEPPHLP
jgi:hypothetical protein